MGEVDDFLADMLPRLEVAERALHQGDHRPRLQTWSQRPPVTLFGALGVVKVGPQEVTEAHGWVASMFSSSTGWKLEVIAAGASGDLAYTVGYERHTTSVAGGPIAPHKLRVTQVYRREDGVWKVVHRHADEVKDDEANEHGTPTA